MCRDTERETKAALTFVFKYFATRATFDGFELFFFSDDDIVNVFLFIDFFRCVRYILQWSGLSSRIIDKRAKNDLYKCKIGWSFDAILFPFHLDFPRILLVHTFVFFVRNLMCYEICFITRIFTLFECNSCPNNEIFSIFFFTQFSIAFCNAFTLWKFVSL